MVKVAAASPGLGIGSDPIVPSIRPLDLIGLPTIDVWGIPGQIRLDEFDHAPQRIGFTGLRSLQVAIFQEFGQSPVGIGAIDAVGFASVVTEAR